jgi:hypothetical protein
LTLSAATFTANLDRNPITLGESATLSLTFEGGTPAQDPTLPAIPNLQITYIGPSSRFSVINGQVSSSVTYNYTVVPGQAGDFIIPSITAAVSGQKLATQPLRLTVLKPGTTGAGVGSAEGQLALLRLLLPKKELYVGETVEAQLELLVNEKVQGAHDFQPAAIPAEGFNLGKLLQGQQRRVQAGSAVFALNPWAFTLAPVKNGSLSVGPITASLVVELPSARRRRDPLWDPFGLLNPPEQRTLSLATEAQSVQVLPLPPEGAPPDFNGAIGDYSLTVTAGPTNVAVGDPITVKIQVAGSGTLDSLALPNQPAWHNFKIYPATSKTETSDALGTRGVKIFEEVVVPQTADITELPPLSFSYFDVGRKSYRTLTGPPIPLAVRPGGVAAVPVIAAGNRGAPENQPPTQDIVPIKQRLGEIGQIAPPLVQQPWFLTLQGAPVLAWLGTVVWRKRNDKLAHNPRLRRRRQVVRLVRAGQADLRRYAAENNSDQFFATLFRLLQEQLGERLDVPASAITEAVIEEHLRPGDVPERTLSGLHDLFQACNLARYAPIKTSQALAAFIPQIETVLRELEEAKR